ncbi:MAG TPA: glutathione S-transferase [Polyangiales bacterium]|nr:glutathione S-transferase [Polyangiales bacterium]
MLIYGAPYPAPNPRRVRMYLAEKGLSPPYTDVDMLARGHKAPDFVAKNSLGQVPTLVLDDGTAISESVAICRYFEALHPDPPLFGTTPLEQASIEMWMRRIELQLMQPIGLFWVNAHPLTAGLSAQKHKDFGEAQKRRALDRMRWLDREIAGREFVAGAAFSMADIIAESAIDFAKFVGIPLPEDVPALAAWRARMKQRPSFRA